MGEEHVQNDLIGMALRASNIIYWDYDLEKNIYHRGGDNSDFFGMSETIEDFSNRIIEEGFLHSESFDDFRKLDKEVHEGKQGASGEFLIKGNDGAWRWYQITYTLLFHEDNKPYWAMGIASDITRQKEMEQHYQEEMMYHEVLDSNLLASGRINLTKLEVEEVKFGSEVQYQYNGARVTPDFYEAFTKYIVIPEERKAFLKAFQREKLLSAYAEGKSTVELEHHIQSEDKKKHWVCTSGIMTKKPGADEIIIFVYTRNVNDEKITQEMLNAVAALDYEYLLVIDGSSNSYIQYAGNNSDLLSSSDFTGKKYDADRIRVIYKYVVKQEQDRCMLETSLANIFRQLELGESYVIFVTTHNEENRLSTKKLSFFYMDRESSKIIFAMTDVTEMFHEEKRKNELLRDALKATEQANMAKGEFLSKMSHEIRTPMNAIMGLTSIALREKDFTKVKTDLKKIDVSAKFLLSLINDILDMTRIESGKMTLDEEQIVMKDFIKEIDTMIKPQAAAKGIRYVSEVDSGISRYFIGDPVKLQQVLINILGNSVKFTKEGGRVSLKVEQVRQNDDMATLRFTMSDNGIGMSEAFMLHMFEPFSQEHTGSTNTYSGTGLGLAISKNLVNMMNGSIHVNSTVGEGTEFQVDIMLKISNFLNNWDEEMTIDEEPSHYDFSGKRVLLVEDNEYNLDVTKVLLSEVGFEVETASDGAQAVDMFWKSESGYYDAILMDIRMPVMDGLSATINIRELQKADSHTIPIIAMTANAFAEDMEKSRASGMNAHLSKPIDTDEMYHTLSHYIFSA